MKTQIQKLAGFIHQRSYQDISPGAVLQLKLRLLDSLGCAIGALSAKPIQALHAYIEELGGKPLVTLIGGGKTSPDRGALYNAALIRYLDFNDSYIAKGETCHPSDNIAAVLAAAEYNNASGKDFLTALAIAYQVQCRLSDVAPVRDKGFDHTTQGSYAVAAGVAKALRLSEDQIANALAISGTAFNALRVTRTGKISHWKGLAYPNTVFSATHATFLAMYGITGPLEVFEGNKGFMHTITGPFSIDWRRENLEAVRRTSIKKFNAEFHSQPTIEGILALRKKYNLHAKDIQSIKIAIFDVAHKIIGGGEEGNKHKVRTKEEADHSLPYMAAVALLDGEVTPRQYTETRIHQRDVHALMQKISVEVDESFSKKFPEYMISKIEIRLQNGTLLQLEKKEYEGFYTKPLSFPDVEAKFHELALPYASETLRKEIIETVKHIEQKKIRDLTSLLATIG